MRWIDQKILKGGSTAATNLLVLSGILAVGGCADYKGDAADADPGAALAALMADGPLPAAMTPMLAPSLPPRDCGGGGRPFDGGIDDGDVVVGGGGSAGASSGSSGSSSGSSGGPGVMTGAGGAIGVPAGGSSGGGSSGKGGMGGTGMVDGGMAEFDGGVGEPEPSCEGVPIGFWTFNDCSPERTDLRDSSFQDHTAFRNVVLACVDGQEGLATSFAANGDMVYAPDQPDFVLDQGVTLAAWVKPDRVDGVSTIFRKRDDADSAVAMVINAKKFQFIVKLTSGKLVSVSTAAAAGKWTHIAGTYDGEYLRLYKDGSEVSSTKAAGTIANGVGPLLMGNDIKERRLRGLMDNAWFNTLAAPADVIMKLTCLHHDPTLTVSPATSPAVPGGTTVTYTLSLTSHNSASCDPAQFETFVEVPDQFSAVPRFAFIESLASGATATQPFDVASGEDTEPGTYPLNFFAFSFNGNFTEFQTQAEYVVAEPTGCFVRTARELMIRDVSVVDDPIRTTFDGPADDPRTGAWTFGRLMEQMAPTPAQAPDMVEQLFQTWLTDQTVNTFLVPARTQMQQLVLDSFPRLANGKLDLTRSPLRLLAIVNRIDLRNLADGKAGEGRFVFGVLDQFGNQTQFTVILEYRLPAKTTADVMDWATRWHNLQTLPFPSEEYNAALQAITERFAGRNAEPGRPNGSALGQLRTNEIALSDVWELREFLLSATTGFMQEAPVALTPDTGFISESPVIADFVNQNEATILTETHVVPAMFQGSPLLGGSSFNNLIAWTSSGITNNEARHKFSLNTCNGCHSDQETGTRFLQINPREPGEEAFLSGFLTGITVSDPVTGEPRTLNDLKRRRTDLTQMVCTDVAPAVIPIGAAPAASASSAAAPAAAASPAARRKAFLSKGISRVH